MLDDVTISALHAALSGLSQRQQAISDNIANVNTPFFTAKRVSFESDLQNALDTGQDPMSVTPTVSASTDPYGLTENNVNLDTETVLAAKTQLQYELALRATGDRFTLISTAIKGS